MKPLPCPARLLPALPFLLAALAADRPAPSIMALMHKQYTNSRAPFKTIKKAIESPSPDWDSVREAAEAFTGLAAGLGRNTPLDGTPESWERLVGRHRADAAAMAEAAAGRDLEKLRAAHRRIAESCTACHRAHRARGEP